MIPPRCHRPIPSGVSNRMHQVSGSLGPEDLGGYDVDPDVRANTRAVMQRLAAAGAHVDEIALGLDPREIGETLLTHTGHMLLPMLERQTQEGDLMPHSTRLVERALEASRAPVQATIEVENRLYSELASIFAEYEAFVCPALTVPAFPLVPEQTDFTPNLIGAAFTICSRHPYVSVPSGLSADGVPTAVLVVGPRHSEKAALRAAAAVQSHPARSGARARELARHPSGRRRCGDSRSVPADAVRHPFDRRTSPTWSPICSGRGSSRRWLSLARTGGSYFLRDPGLCGVMQASALGARATDDAVTGTGTASSELQTLVELFGPVLSVESVENVDAACAVVAEGSRALTGGLFSRDPQSSSA